MFPYCDRILSHQNATNSLVPRNRRIVIVTFSYRIKPFLPKPELTLESLDDKKEGGGVWRGEHVEISVQQRPCTGEVHVARIMGRSIIMHRPDNRRFGW